MFVWMVMFALLGTACESPSENPSSPTDQTLRVTCTTGMIADLVQNIAGEHAEVIALMGPGVDPHLYKASQSDLKKLTSAHLVVYNGLHLEGKMADVLQKLGRTSYVLALGDHIPDGALLTVDGAGTVDPHIWFDVSLWQSLISTVEKELSTLDPKHAELYRSNAQAYYEKLGGLDRFVTIQLSTIPVPNRVLVTAHDAFGYFGRAYGIEVVGLQGISTVSEAGLRDVSNLVDLLSERKIPAVFVESSVPTRNIEAVIAGCQSRGHEVKLGGTLFSDAMGAEGSPEGTYIGMVTHNVNTLTQALK